jgi:hypothetical protein
MKNRFSMAISLALVLALIAATFALADNLLTNGDGLTPVVDTQTLALGNVCLNSTTTKPIAHAVSRNGNYSNANVFLKGSTVSVSIGTVTGNGLSATGGGSILIPANWDTASNNTLSPDVFSSVQFVANSAGPFSGTVNYNASGTKASGGTLNLTDSLTVTATVISCDTTEPELTLPSDITEEATSAAGAAVSFVATATDANPSNPAVTCDPASGSTFPLGPTTVDCSTTDAAGNTAMGSFTITVVDTTAPDITTPDDITIEAADASGAVVTYTGESAYDLVDGSVTVSCTPASGSTFPLGLTEVTCYAIDEQNNDDSKSFTIDVTDTTAPALLLSDDITEEATSAAGAVVNFSASASDLVDGSVAVDCDANSGDTFPLGSTLVSCSATDSNGNTSSGTFNVTVVDTTAPSLSLPVDFSVEATGPAGAVATFSATASDIVDGAVSVACVPGSGSTFPLGPTTVDCSATDAAGNTAMGSFQISVVDTTAPDLTLPADQSLEATGPGGAAATFVASASDMVDGSLAVSCDANSGDTFPLGTTTVNCLVSDDAGNTASGSFVIIVEDTTAPSLTLPSDQTFEGNTTGGYNGAYSGATATDIVDASPSVSCVPASPSFFALGDTQVDCTAEDASGNSSNGSFTVTVVDTTAPSIADNPDVVIAATGPSGAVVNFSNPAASDIVDSNVNVVCVPASGSTFAPGHTTVICTATDDSGNSAQSSFDVWVKFQLHGFYQPVDMNGVYNIVRNGSTVPLKFEIVAGSTELMDVAAVESLTYAQITCSGSVLTDEIETLVTGNTVLRYDTTSGQFVFNWKTPSGTAGKCFRVTMLTDDGSSLVAYFKMK